MQALHVGQAGASLLQSSCQGLFPLLGLLQLTLTGGCGCRMGGLLQLAVLQEVPD